MNHHIRTITLAFVLVAAVAASAGCVGIYDNTANFTPGPRKGMSEAALLKEHGTPAWSGFLDGTTKVYIYKVRRNRFFFVVGFYEGHDLVITVRNGLVDEVAEAPRAKTQSFFQPTPWAETE